ncbi:hypothetical protein F4778DRAFT_82313 [Xylariomycetidae sp. FL2044]|nr:hypothetical protein F4778DRAFT_82313 [Xylariomycetidae sp. FL2044]
MTAGPLRGHYHSPSSAGSASSNSAAARLILTPDSSGSGVDSDSDDDGGRPGDISLNDGGEVGSGFRFGFEGEDEGETYELQDRRSSTPWDLEQDEEEEEDEDGHESEGSRSRRSRRRRRRRRRRSDDGSVASFQLYTPDEERAVVRKFDRRLVLFLSLCYMLSFLDRSSMSACSALLCSILHYHPSTSHPTFSP